MKWSVCPYVTLNDQWPVVDDEWCSCMIGAKWGPDESLQTNVTLWRVLQGDFKIWTFYGQNVNPLMTFSAASIHYGLVPWWPLDASLELRTDWTWSFTLVNTAASAQIQPSGRELRVCLLCVLSTESCKDSTRTTNVPSHTYQCINNGLEKQLNH